MPLLFTHTIGKHHFILVAVTSLALTSLPSSALTNIARHQHQQPQPCRTSELTTIARHQLTCKTTTESALMMENPTQSSSNDDNNLNEITILGFGSLLSLQSARLTFPTLKNFRMGRVPNHRRVFAHPASIFFQREIANLDTLEMSSLSCEYEEGHSFVCSVFEVPNEGLSAEVVSEDGHDKTTGNWIPSQAFLEREEEFLIDMVPFDELTSVVAEDGVVPMRTETTLSDDTTTSSSTSDKSSVKKGVICLRSTDEAYLSMWGESHWKNQYSNYGVKTIWSWERDSGLKPCPVYLRHCVLASWNCGEGANTDEWSSDGSGGICYNSFLDETYLVDRKTTVREYLKQCPGVMATEPPEGLKHRYGG